MDKCIDDKDHDLERVGYLICALEPNVKNTSTSSIPSGSLMTWSVSGNKVLKPDISHYQNFQVYLTTDIEVLQCTKCGEVKLTPAVFHKILEE